MIQMTPEMMMLWTAYLSLWAVMGVEPTPNPNLKDALMHLRWEIADRGWRIYSDADSFQLCIQPFDLKPKRTKRASRRSK